MTTWMFVALLWFDHGTSWPDVIWSFAYQEQAKCEQSALESARVWSRKPQVSHVLVSACFRWTVYRGKEV